MSTVAQLEEATERPLFPSAVLAVGLFVGAEAMLFAGLVSAILVLRAGAAAWPAAALWPRGISLLNLVALLVSGVAAWRAARAPKPERARRALALAAGLGALFLLVQGWEWARMLGAAPARPLSLHASVFYATLAIHGAHVLGGLGALLLVLWVDRRRPGWAMERGRLSAAALYWGFVVVVWPALYALVYP